jgi:hypothetical protein
MGNPVQDIINSTNSWGGWEHQNSQLELASLSLEAKRAGLSIEPLRDIWFKQRDATRKSRGIFLRSPEGTHHSAIANSHDNWVGIAVLSFLFDDGKTAKEILDEGLTFGLWITGKNERGHWIDSEWFTPWRPEYRAIMKLAAGRKITAIEDLFLRANIYLSKAWNMKRVRLLFLDAIGYDRKFIELELARLGDKYRGRYGDDPLYWNLWKLQTK